MSSSLEFLVRAFERCDNELQEAKAAIARVRKHHTPTDGDDHTDRRCTGCISGYDPRTGQLVSSAWPCPTIRALSDTEED